MLTPEQFRRHNFSINALGFYKADDVDSFLSEAADSYEQVVAECNSLRQKMGFLAQKLEDYRQDEGTLASALLVAQRTADKMVKDAQAKADKLKEESTDNAESMIFDAKRYSEQMISEATKKAQDLTVQSQAEADKRLNDAKESAQVTISVAETQAQTLLNEAEASSKDKIEKAEREAEDIIYRATGKAQEDLKTLTANIEKEKVALENIRRESDKFRSQLMELYRAHIELITQIPEYEEEEAQTQPDEDEEAKIEETGASEEKSLPEAEIDGSEEVEEMTEEPASEDTCDEIKEKDVSEEKENSGIIDEFTFENVKSALEQNEGFHLNLDELD